MFLEGDDGDSTAETMTEVGEGNKLEECTIICIILKETLKTPWAILIFNSMVSLYSEYAAMEHFFMYSLMF